MLAPLSLYLVFCFLLFNLLCKSYIHRIIFVSVLSVYLFLVTPLYTLTASITNILFSLTFSCSYSYSFTYSYPTFHHLLSFLATLADGLHDLIHFPAVGLRTSPAAFAFGIAHGMSSLLKKTVSSLCVTASDLSESLQVGLIALGVVDPSLSSLELFSSSQYTQYSSMKTIKNTPENTNKNDNDNGDKNSPNSVLTVSQNDRNASNSLKMINSSNPSYTENNNTVLGNNLGPLRTLGYDPNRNYRPKGGFEGVKQGTECKVLCVLC